jgi:hypothetical protein
LYSLLPQELIDTEPCWLNFPHQTCIPPISN